MIVKNMTSSRSGKPIANQFIITVDNMQIFQSYKTVIAVRRADNPEVVLLDYNYSYSPTTSKYLYQFLGFKKERINMKVQDNSIRIMDLNYNATDTSTTYEYKTAMHNQFMKFINTEHSTA
tara:strand:+ start:199 stop:561 length:363 start_codon:yes stop_codon:yes gene_type:complete